MLQKKSYTKSLIACYIRIQLACRWCSSQTALLTLRFFPTWYGKQIHRRLVMGRKSTLERSLSPGCVNAVKKLTRRLLLDFPNGSRSPFTRRKFLPFAPLRLSASGAKTFFAQRLTSESLINWDENRITDCGATNWWFKILLAFKA